MTHSDDVEHLLPWDRAGHSQAAREAMCARLSAWSKQASELLSTVRFDATEDVELRLGALVQIVTMLDVLTWSSESEADEELSVRITALRDQIEAARDEWRAASKQARRLANRRIRAG